MLRHAVIDSAYVSRSVHANYCGFSHISAHHIGALHNDFNACTVNSLQKDLNSNIKEKLLHLLLFAFHIE